MNPNVWESGAIATPPSPPVTPSTGYPTKGDPALGVPPTKGGDYWFYQFAAEITAILVAAGITPDHENLTQLLTAFNALYAPRGPGRIELFAMNSAPAGYLKANGALVSRTTYADLFAAIGTTFGVGDGTTTFGLPDLRGEFIRMWDDGRGVDSGRVFGSAQADAFKSHLHSDSCSGLYGGNGGAGVGSAEIPLPGSTGSTGDTETRPRNIALLACIKF